MRSDVVESIRFWISQNRIEVLNIAGPRASKEPGIYEEISAVLNDVLKRRAQAGVWDE